MSEGTMLEALRRSCLEWPDRTALVARDAAVTYGKLWEAATRQAGLYRRLGVRRGDRVVCALPNCPEHVATMGAAWAAGAVHVAIDSRATDDEVAWLAAHVQATLVLAGRTGAEVSDGRRAALRAACPDVRIVTSDETAASEPPPGLAGAVDEVGQQEPAMIRFSSGTTGTPKGAVARHGPTAAAWTNLAAALGVGPDDVHLGHLPLAFAFGLQMAMMPLLTGGTLVLMERFAAEAARRLIRRHRVTVFDGSPANFRLLLDVPDSSPEQVESLRLGVGSADHFPPRLIARIFDELGMEFVLMYGTMEGFGMISSDRRRLLAGSVGRPAPGSVLVIGADGRPARAGEAGEVTFRRHPDSPAYWRRPADGGWYRSGDAGRLDKDGWLRLSGRLKHQINRGGLKVDPVEVADQLRACPGVADAAAVGVPDPLLGEIPCACVVPTAPDAAPTLEDVQEQLRRVLAPFKVPAALCVLPELPLTSNGKLDVERLRRQAVDAAGRRPAGPDEAPRPDGESGGSLRSARLVTLPVVEQELARLIYGLRDLRAGLGPHDRALLGQVAAAAADHARDRRAAAAPRDRFVKPLVCAATTGMRAWWGDLPVLLDLAPGAARQDPPAPPPGQGRPALVGALRGLVEAGDEVERLAWRLFLGCARRALVPHRHLPRGPGREAAEVVLAVLSVLLGPAPLYVGRPAFVTEDLLAALRAEAARQRPAAVFEQNCLMARPGPVARRLAALEELRTLLAGLGQRAEPVGTGKYVYCDGTARGPGEHLHTEPFVLNVELSLEHDRAGAEAAQIVLCPPWEEARPVHTEPGDMVVWFAGSVPHARDEMSPGQSLTAISMFFEPVR
jgi:acyl-CoA synthetase (AMP-forming)/AMP-acid ligase II